MLIFQFKISAQNTKVSEKKASPKTFQSSKKDVSLKKEKTKPSVNKERLNKKALRVTSVTPNKESVSKSKETIVIDNTINRRKKKITKATVISK